MGSCKPLGIVAYIAQGVFDEIHPQLDSLIPPKGEVEGLQSQEKGQGDDQTDSYTGTDPFVSQQEATQPKPEQADPQKTEQDEFFLREIVEK